MVSASPVSFLLLLPLPWSCNPSQADRLPALRRSGFSVANLNSEEFIEYRYTPVFESSRSTTLLL